MPEPERRIRVSLGDQTLALVEGGRVLRRYPISSAARGAGEQTGSERTPRGAHVVRAKIGAGCAPGTVFLGRRPTGEICTAELYRKEPERDWILTRILWLSGLEPGRNRLGDVDTMRRFIYIHGCPDEVPLGEPASHGCIRMHGPDVIDLFDRVAAGTRVDVQD